MILATVCEITHRSEYLKERMTAEVECYCDYCDADDELLKHFFRCSLLDRWDCFDFDRAFSCVIHEIERKLAEHGLCDFEDFLDQMGYFYDKRDLEQFASCTGWVSISVDDVFEAIMRLHYDRMREEFDGDDTFCELQILVGRYNDGEWNNSIQAAITLFDACIHAEHHTGLVLEMVGDPDCLRGEVQKELDGETRSVGSTAETATNGSES